MIGTGIKGIRAAFTDAMDDLSRTAGFYDPLPNLERDGIEPGKWPGAPSDRLPPNCPVVPLGVDGKTTFLVDTLGQLIPVSASEWSKKLLVQLFARQPNYIYWAWPRFNAKTQQINGCDTDEAMACLMKAAASRGLFSPTDRVRGRGAWTARDGSLLWHAGEMIYRVEGKRLQAAPAGEVDGIFYPTRPQITKPWSEPVPADDSPAHGLLEDLRSWSWERPELDPLLVLGWIGCAFLGGALSWRPHLFAIGDKGVGKSTLQAVVKGVLDTALHNSADTTAAGIYQRVKQDSLPVAIDELEAGADNRRVMAVVALARLAASGAMMYRGGAEHEGVEFRLQNAFFFSAINPPPLEPQDRSRMAVVSLGRLDPSRIRSEPVIDADVTGRMILRQLMDGWPTYQRTLSFWRDSLRAGGLDSRAQDTYGTLLAVAHLLLGDLGMADAHVPLTEGSLGSWVARRTRDDRAAGTDNWRACLEYLLDCTIDAWRNGERPTIGRVLNDWEERIISTKEANERLGLVGLVVRLETDDGRIAQDGEKAARWMVCVPLQSALLAKLYSGTKWNGGVWASALKQAAGDVVVRDRGNGQNVKINRKAARCLFVDLAAYDRATKRDDEEGE